jgi:hypothetical protein
MHTQAAGAHFLTVHFTETFADRSIDRSIAPQTPQAITGRREPETLR